jgi:hypothetical protein
MKTNNVLTDKYLPVENGIYFIAPVRSLEAITTESDVARSKDFIYLRSGDTYAPLHDEIMNHLNNVMKKHNTVFITFSYCHPEEYAIRDAFTIKMDKTECATIIGFYNVFKQQILKEKNAAVNE